MLNLIRLKSRIQIRQELQLLIVVHLYLSLVLLILSRLNDLATAYFERTSPIQVISGMALGWDTAITRRGTVTPEVLRQLLWMLVNILNSQP